MMTPTITNLVERAVSTAKRQYQAGLKYRQPRFEEIRRIEDMYFGKVDPALPGRYNIPLPIMEGYVQTLLSKIDNPPKIIFERKRGQDLIRSKKVTAAWEQDSAAGAGDWASKDLDAKKLAILSGRGILKIYSDRNPDYKNHLEVVDYYDFICEPSGGNHLEDHIFMGQMNIYRTAKQLREGGQYDKQAVRRLMASRASSDFKKIDEDQYQFKLRRLRALGLDPDTNNYVGDDIYRLCEWGMQLDGERFYLLFDPVVGEAVRFEPLRDVFSSNLWHWVSWATDVEPFNFWSRGPCDLVRPAAEAIRIAYNQTLDNIQKRNWEMKIYDKRIIPDPVQLKYRPDGLVAANIPDGGNIANGLKLLETADTTGNTIAIINFTRGLLGTETGITDAAKGVSDQNRVGINDTDLQQVADRLGLTNKLYSQCWTELGVRYDWGLYDNMPRAMMIEMIGSQGAEWHELKREDVEPDYTTRVVGGSAEQSAEAAKSKKKTEALNALMAANLAGVFNQRVLAEEFLRDGEFDESRIKALLDKQTDGDDELVARAEGAISDILSSREPRKYRGATTYFIQYILDYAYDNVLDSDPARDLELFNALKTYAEAHFTFAEENTTRRLMNEKAAAAAIPGEATAVLAGETTTPPGEATPAPAGAPPGMATPPAAAVVPPAATPIR